MKSLYYFLKTQRGKSVGLSAILLGFSAMFCFMGYELIRSGSESIFLSVFSASDKIYALAITPFFLFCLIYLYGVLLSKYGSKKTMIIYFIFVIVSIGIISFFCFKKITPAIFFILVFKESYVVILSEMYWSYINSILTKDEAKIINGPMAGIAASGSLLGGFFVSRYVVKLSTELVVFITVLLLIPSLILFYYSYKFGGEPKPNEDEEGGKKGTLHLSIIFENKTVFILAIMVFLSQVFSTLSDINFTSYIKNIPDKDIRTSYLGSFWTKVNVISFIMQFIVTSVLLRKFNVKYILFVIPIIHFSTSLYSFLYPSLFSASLVFMIFKSLDYSIYRASKEILYIPFSYDTRYRVKQFVDAFLYRFSKGAVSITLSLLTLSSIAFMGYITQFLMAISLIWCYIISIIKKENQ